MLRRRWSSSLALLAGGLLALSLPAPARAIDCLKSTYNTTGFAQNGQIVTLAGVELIEEFAGTLGGYQGFGSVFDTVLGFSGYVGPSEFCSAGFSVADHSFDMLGWVWDGPYSLPDPAVTFQKLPDGSVKLIIAPSPNATCDELVENAHVTITSTGGPLSTLTTDPLTPPAGSCPGTVQQPFPSGKTWTLAFDKREYVGSTTKIYYDLSVNPPGNTLSHLIFGACREVQRSVTSVTRDGVPVSFNFSTASTDLQGIKIQSAKAGKYCLTISGRWRTSENSNMCAQVALKDSSSTFTHSINGVLCGLLPTNEITLDNFTLAPNGPAKEILVPASMIGQNGQHVTFRGRVTCVGIPNNPVSVAFRDNAFRNRPVFYDIDWVENGNPPPDQQQVPINVSLSARDPDGSNMASLVLAEVREVSKQTGTGLPPLPGPPLTLDSSLVKLTQTKKLAGGALFLRVQLLLTRGKCYAVRFRGTDSQNPPDVGHVTVVVDLTGQ